MSLDKFIDSKYRFSEFRDLDARFRTGLGPSSMRYDCAVAVTIPTQYMERRVHATLAIYNQLAAGNRFEVLMLINGPKGVDLTSSPAFEGVVSAQTDFPKLQISAYTVNYEPSALRIGRIRGDLATMALIRATEASIDPANLAIVTNDADLFGLPDNYVNKIAATLARNTAISGVTGPVKYPNAGLSKDDLVLAVQSFEDAYEKRAREEQGHLLMRGGNSAFNAASYIEAGGHARARVSENRPLLRFLRAQNPQSVIFDEEMWILTSPRRLTMAVKRNQRIAQKHANFGRVGDLAEDYQLPVEELSLPEYTHRVTSPAFQQSLAQELQSAWGFHLITSYRGIEGKMPTSLSVAQVYEVLSQKAPEELVRLQNAMKEAGTDIGIKVCFTDERLSVGSIKTLKHNILESSHNL